MSLGNYDFKTTKTPEGVRKFDLLLNCFSAEEEEEEQLILSSFTMSVTTCLAPALHLLSVTPVDHHGTMNRWWRGSHDSDLQELRSPGVLE